MHFFRSPDNSVPWQLYQFSTRPSNIEHPPEHERPQPADFKMQYLKTKAIKITETDFTDLMKQCNVLKKSDIHLCVS